MWSTAKNKLLMVSHSGASEIEADLQNSARWETVLRAALRLCTSIELRISVTEGVCIWSCHTRWEDTSSGSLQRAAWSKKLDGSARRSYVTPTTAPVSNPFYRTWARMSIGSGTTRVSVCYVKSTIPGEVRVAFSLRQSPRNLTYPIKLSKRCSLRRTRNRYRKER